MRKEFHCQHHTSDRIFLCVLSLYLGTVPVGVTSVESVQMSTGKPQSLEPDKTTEIIESNTNPLITDKQMDGEEIKYKLFPDQLTWG